MSSFISSPTGVDGLSLSLIHIYVAHAVNIPVVGLGGISSAKDAIEFLMCGEMCIRDRGLDNPSTPVGELMKELIFFILH